MSSQIFKINCLKCNFETDTMFHVFLHKYELPDNKLISIKTIDGWCFKCRDYYYIEDKVPKAVKEKIFFLRNEVEKLKIKSKSSARSLLGFNLKIHDKIKNALDNLENCVFEEQKISRKNGAKCLKCSSTDVIPYNLPTTRKTSYDVNIKKDISEITHPNCGGYLEVKPGFRISFSVINVRIYNIDGVFIRMKNIDKP